MDLDLGEPLTKHGSPDLRGHMLVQAGQTPRQGCRGSWAAGPGAQPVAQESGSQAAFRNQPGFMSHDWAVSRKQREGSRL